MTHLKMIKHWESDEWGQNDDKGWILSHKGWPESRICMNLIVKLVEQYLDIVGTAGIVG